KTSREVSNVSALFARSGAHRSRKIASGPGCRSCHHAHREKIAWRDSGAAVTRAAIDSARPQKVQAGSRRSVVEAGQNRGNADHFPTDGPGSPVFPERS